MKEVILLLDSSNVDLAVGIEIHDLTTNSKEVFYTIYEAWQAQSEYMIQEIDKLLNEHSVSKEMIKTIMVGIGPGSYTGVRISITIAKVMALALNIDIIPVSSLAILSTAAPCICVMNARSKRSYIGVYNRGQVILEDQIMSNEDVQKYIVEHPDYIVCGDADYLGIDGYKGNVIIQMLALKDCYKKCEDILALKPIYLKD